jgi:cytochrome c553
MTRLRRALALAVLLLLVACSTTEHPERAVVRSAGGPRPCPEPRQTERAPDPYQALVNPLADTHLDRGRRLYEKDARPIPCAACHGMDGSGRGPMGESLVPPPRDFTCAATMSLLSDGQLYWVVERGAGAFHVESEEGAQRIERPGRGAGFTAMRGHASHLSQTDIWSVILYLRTFAPQK